MKSDGDVVFDTRLDETGLKSGLKKVDKSTGKWANSALSATKLLKSAGVVAFGALAKSAISYNASMEDYTTNFGVMLGDEAAALQYVTDLREMAARTPFGMQDLASASQTLMAFGLGAEATTKAMQQLGDISLGNNQRFQQLSLAFAQVSSAGKLTGQDLLQMINAGFNPLQIIAEQSGASIADLKEVMAGGKGSKAFQKQVKAAQKEVAQLGAQASTGAKMLAKIGEEGYISAEMVGEAMSIATSPGGKFYGGMEQASHTMNGMISTLKDGAMELLGNVFQPLTDGIKSDLIPMAMRAVESLNQLVTGQEPIVFEGQIDINKAQESLETLGTDIDNLRNDYAKNMITINLNIGNATEIAAQIDEIMAKPENEWTQEDVDLLKSLTKELVTIMPELSDYVGSSGIIDADTQSVKALVAEYGNLARAKATAEYIGSAESRLAQAEIDLEYLREQRRGLIANRDAAAEHEATMRELASSTRALLGGEGFNEVAAEDVRAGVDLLNDYFAAGGTLDTLLKTTSGQAVDWSAIIGADGLVDASKVLASGEAGVASMGNVLNALWGATNAGAIEAKTAHEAYVKEITESDTAVANAMAEIEDARADIELRRKVAENFERDNILGQTGSSLVDEAAKGAEESAALAEGVQTSVYNAIESTDVSGFSSVGAEIPAGMAQGIQGNISTLTNAATAMAQAALAAVKATLGIHSPSAVFRDSVGAMISDGIAVGVESEAYRVRKAVNSMVLDSMPDVRGIGARTAANVATALDGGNIAAASRYGAFTQNNTFNVPVQTPDEFAKTMHLYATYGLAGG